MYLKQITAQDSYASIKLWWEAGNTKSMIGQIM
jgi:hypothetical protein